MFKNIGANWILTALNILSAYVLMPYSVKMLGKESYGVWLLLTSVAGYLSLLLIGTPMAGVKFISAELKSSSENSQLSLMVSVFSLINKILFLTALLASIVLYFLFGSLYEIPLPIRDDTNLALFILLLSTSGGFLLQLPYSVMAAHGDFVRRNKILSFIVLLKFFSTIVFLSLRSNISTLAFIQGSAFLVETVLCWRTFRVKYEEWGMRKGKFDSAIFKKVLNFSVYVMILNIGIQLSYQTDALVVGAMLTVAAVAPYSIANSLTVYFMELIIAIAAVILPEAARLSAASKLDELRFLFFKWSKISTLICFPAFIFCYIYGEAFLTWWVGEEIAKEGSVVLSTLMLSFLIFLPVRGVSQPILMGRGIVKAPTVAFLIAGIGNLVMSVALANSMGLLGVAIGTAVPNLIFAFFLLGLCVKELKTSVSKYLLDVFLKPFLVAAPIFVFLIWLGPDYRQPKFLNLFISGAVLTASYLIISAFTVYRTDEHIAAELNAIKRKLKR